MNFLSRATTLVALGALVLPLTACGTHVVGASAVRTAAAAVTAQGVPPTSAFQNVNVAVTQILPKDTSGLPHQNFVVKVTDGPDAGMTLEVNNDTKFGQEVTGMKVGDKLEIRGVEYHDKGKDGIHWTHHANKMGDAGFIKNADGKTFQ